MDVLLERSVSTRSGLQPKTEFSVLFSGQLKQQRALDAFKFPNLRGRSLRQHCFEVMAGEAYAAEDVYFEQALPIRFS